MQILQYSLSVDAALPSKQRQPQVRKSTAKMLATCTTSNTFLSLPTHTTPPIRPNNLTPVFRHTQRSTPRYVNTTLTHGSHSSTTPPAYPHQPVSVSPPQTHPPRHRASPQLPETLPTWSLLGQHRDVLDSVHSAGKCLLPKLVVRYVHCTVFLTEGCSHKGAE